MFATLQLLILQLVVLHPYNALSNRTALKNCYPSTRLNGLVRPAHSWSHPIDDGRYYYSEPLCLNEYMTYILRECGDDGQFIGDVPTCASFQVDKPKCLYGDVIKYMDLPTGKYCYEVSSEAMKPDEPFACSYNSYYIPNHVEFENNYLGMIYNIAGYTKGGVWVGYTQKITSGGVGDFQVDLLMPEYFSSEHSGAGEKNCLFFKYENGVLGPELETNCNAENKKSCLYNTIQWDQSSLTLQPNACAEIGEECMLSWEISEYEGIKCICPLPTLECEKPAVFPLGKKNCKLNLEISSDGNLVWKTTQETVTSTFWSWYNLQTKFKKYIIWASDNTGWTTTDEDFDCIMCEVNLPLGKPEIVLSYDKESKEMFMGVKNRKRLYDGSTYGDFKFGFSIVCYSDYMMGMQRDIQTEYIWHLEGSAIWQCEGFDLKNVSQKIKSNQVKVHNDNVYVIKFVGRGYSTTYLTYLHITDCHTELEGIIRESINTMKFLRVTHRDPDLIDKELATYMYRLTTTKSDVDKYNSDYYTLKTLFENIPFTWMPIAKYSKLEIFNLNFCASIKTTIKGYEINWPETNIGEMAETNCFDHDGNVMKMKCIGNFTFGARWDNLPGCISFGDDTTTSEKSQELADLQESDAPSTEIAANLTTIISDSYDKLVAYDVNLIANIIEKVTNEIPVESVIDIVSNVMKIGSKELEKSQITQNGTDKILFSLDVALKTQMTSHNYIRSIRSNITITENLVNIMPDLGMEAGLAYIGKQTFKMLASNMTLDEILSCENLKVAAFVNTTNANMSSLTFFMSSNLFNTNGTNASRYETYPIIMSILLPDEVDNVEVLLIFKDRPESQCGYWQYGNDQYGKWQVTENVSSQIGEFTICTYNHTTHFGNLIMLHNTLTEHSNNILSTITLVECIFSCLGIAAIFMTAIFFPRWRDGKIQLLHFCFIILLQTILMFLSDGIKKSSNLWCIMIGALLQFSVLSEFSWMVIIAWNQYNRFVRVYHSESQNRLLKIMVFTYGLPSLIVGIVLAVDRKTYLHSNLDITICYPSGTVLLVSMLIPAGMVMIINGLMFARILAELFCLAQCREAKLRTPTERRSDTKQKIKQIGLMVFSLGLTWWFGIIGSLLDNDVLLYLFSITTSLHGFVIFVFVLLCNKRVYMMYLKHFPCLKRCFTSTKK